MGSSPVIDGRTPRGRATSPSDAGKLLAWNQINDVERERNASGPSAIRMDVINDEAPPGA
jgi:hypothetical protein